MKDKKGLVLCVDDEPNVLRSLHWLLYKDFNVMTAPDGTTGLQMLRKHDFDVIVSDQRMPGMIGSEFLREACKTAPRAMRILLTGYSDMQSILRSVNEGEVFRFVNKPWRNEELVRTVEDAAAIARSNLVPATAATASVPDGGSILLIDDSADMARMIQDLVEPGTVLRHTGNLPEAIQILNTHPVGVIICDTHVGGADATPVIKLLKQQRPEIVSIVLTSDSDVDTIVNLINQGQIYRFLPKPVKPGFMKIMLASALNKHRELKAAPEQAKRYAVEQMEGDVEKRLVEYLHQQPLALVPGTASEAGAASGGSLLGRLSKGFRRLFH